MIYFDVVEGTSGSSKDSKRYKERSNVAAPAGISEYLAMRAVVASYVGCYLYCMLCFLASLQNKRSTDHRPI